MNRLLSILLVLLTTACSVDKLPPRDDRPEGAAAYHALRRAGSDDPHRDYAKARELMKRMPRYSSAADEWREPGRRIEADASEYTDRPFDRWIPLGPGNIGGRTRTLVFDPVDPRILYAGGVSGGIWKSVNGGERWEPIGDELTNLAVSVLVLDPNDRNTIYAGTGEGFFRENVRGTGLPLRGYGIFVSRNAGATWSHLTSTANEDFHWVNDMAIDANGILAATRSGIFRSHDGGASWTRVLDPNVTGGCLDLESGNGFVFAACGTFEQATVYRSTSGAAWSPVLSEPDMGRTVLAVAPSNPSIVYAMATDNKDGMWRQGLLAIYRSEDSGASWQTVTKNDGNNYSLGSVLLSNGVYAQTRRCRSQFQPDQIINMGWYTSVIAVDPVDPNRVWVGSVDLFRSDDGGKSWGVASYWWIDEKHRKFVHADQHRILFHPQYDGVTNKTMYVANDGGIYRTFDARAATAVGDKALCDAGSLKLEYQRLNSNYGVTQFYHGAVFKDGRRFIGGTQDNGTILGSWTDGIDGWRRVAGGDGGYVFIDPVDESIIYAAYQDGNILKSGPGPVMAFRPVRRNLVDDFLFVTPFLLDPNKRERLWTGGTLMWRTDDSAETWAPASAKLPGTVSAIAAAPGRPDRVIAGTHNGYIVRSDSATTANASTAWASTRPREGFVSSLAFDPKDANVVYATYSGFGGEHVWRSSDGGATWSSRSGNLPDIPVHSIAVDPTRRHRLYLGTDLGVFASLDGGVTWAVENTGFAAAVTEAVVIAPGARGQAVYAFTHGRGAWRAELVPMPARRRAVR